MRIRIAKPKDGKTTVVLDDRRGITRMKRTLTDVQATAVGDVVLEQVAEYKERKKAIRDAIRGRSA